MDTTINFTPGDIWKFIHFDDMEMHYLILSQVEDTVPSVMVRELETGFVEEWEANYHYNGEGQWILMT